MARMMIALFLMVATCAAVPEVRQVMLLHRHGARTTLGVKDGRLNCNDPFCQLTRDGKEMLYSLGRHMMNTYGPNGTRLLDANYSVDIVKSRSTAVDRVVTSAEAMLMGMYPDCSPFVDFDQLDTDTTLSYWTSWPSWIIRNTYQRKFSGEAAQQAVIREFGNHTIDVIAKYFNLEALCATTPTDCLVKAWDGYACNVSQPGSVFAPWLTEDLIAKLRLFQIKGLSSLFGYHSDEFDLQIGSYGYYIVKDVLSRFNATIADPRGQPKLLHYGAHDWTISGVFSALGVWTEQQANNTWLIPYFASAIKLELLVDGTKSFVRGTFGTPQQAAGSDHKYTFESVALQCLSNDGVHYLSNSTDHPFGCEFEDVVRFLQRSRAPMSKMGVCYATDTDMIAQDCSVADTPAPGSNCHFYRHHCDSIPCGLQDGMVSDPSDNYKCVPLHRKRDSSGVDAGGVVAAVIPSLVAGLAAGYAYMRVVRSRVM